MSLVASGASMGAPLPACRIGGLIGLPLAGNSMSGGGIGSDLIPLVGCGFSIGEPVVLVIGGLIGPVPCISAIGMLGFFTT